MRATDSGPDARLIRLSRAQEHIRAGFGIVVDLEEFLQPCVAGRCNGLADHDAVPATGLEPVASPQMKRVEASSLMNTF